ncbi:hypothetical protein CBS147339_371 [Penicillium roqueforti]|uniref:Genomic scaffold, ProqFM164S02 n=1 Tax=Penicillium roqueforti (strain FM164) TaxID=1365484 RepID=W6Q3L1_PENRF|nr:hypothetical protein CBS147354_54 [Penicillium roqueforti]CDM30910.1 unnamed protein product [Penicillium roqueforti FM164]KAI3086527.1 hypothetical protein CBS147339_371 [Penicillium roqueforti]KAI3107597.1 hypothetical protein CBS147338_511 [Penicillium roqueforti]KAI3115112.1 hypothetical protein CBS147333_1509 [Penicillium roqueforti]
MSTINPSFQEAIKVTPQGHNKYSAFLRPEWCIGTVPHGGYTTAVIYQLALTHFAHAHPTQYKSAASPISIQLSFLRRTASGSATFEVEDVKIGARTSTIHIKLLQPSEKKPGQLDTMVAGYITVSPPEAEVGISASTGWKPYPAPVAGSRADGSVDLAALGRTGTDGVWTKLETPFSDFRKAAAQIELFGPGAGATQQKRSGNMGIDQWARFRPGGDVNGRWTEAAVAYLIDMFPMVLDGFDTMSATAVAEESGTSVDEEKAKFWYPTVTLNVDMKKHLPAEGVEWLYSRVVTKVVRDGRTDIDVTVLDEDGEVIALSSQVGLVVSASRNLGTRKMEKL